MQTRVALEHFLQHCQSQNLKPSTLSWYRQKLTPFATCYPRLPLKPEAIEAFLGSIHGSPDTRHAYYRSLKAFYPLFQILCQKPT